MRNQVTPIQKRRPDWTLVLDLRDCYTWSFPEFLPFCVDLFYFSSLKDFDASRCGTAA
ncbi:hypothetical protein [Flaviaesturariibacter aridisoli]|uniref:hypothetical protein n=1 Tax=Flaviaesturariibacter aridisoli TaxID=2545761 RepID=UPI00140462BE|nr:hypothetical protein [Flaviaesturariibacter aridisoli]